MFFFFYKATIWCKLHAINSLKLFNESKHVRTSHAARFENTETRNGMSDENVMDKLQLVRF